MTTSPTEFDLTETAALIARHFPEVVPRLQAEHVPDRHGHCRGCPSNNVPARRSPCGLRVLADLAQQLQSR